MNIDLRDHISRALACVSDFDRNLSRFSGFDSRLTQVQLTESERWCSSIRSRTDKAVY